MASPFVYIDNITGVRYYKKKDLIENNITDYKRVDLCLYEHLIKRNTKFYDNSYEMNKDKLIGFKPKDHHERYVSYNFAENLPFDRFFEALERYRNTPSKIKMGASLEKFIVINGCERVGEIKYNEYVNKQKISTTKIWNESTEHQKKIRLPHNIEFYENKYPNDPELAKTEHENYMNLRTEVSKNSVKIMIKAKRKDPSKRNTNIEYFLKIANGDMEEAKRLQKDRQGTNSLVKFQERYGIREGWKLWYRRQRKWQRTLKSKTDEEILEINRRKFSGSNPNNVSKSSVRVFRRLEKEFPEYTFIYGNKSEEFKIKKTSKNYFWYDCYIPEINLIIEYHGCKFHPKPLQYDFPNYRVARAKDLLKKKIAVENGYNYEEVYDDLDFCVIIDFLKEKISGYPRKRTILEEYLF